MSDSFANKKNIFFNQPFLHFEVTNHEVDLNVRTWALRLINNVLLCCMPLKEGWTSFLEK